MYISLDAYRVFYYVAQYGSFTHAADMLYSNQPNVTRTIKNLEQELGCVLFVAGHGDGPAGETERKLAQAVSGFLGKQMES